MAHFRQVAKLMSAFVGGGLVGSQVSKPVENWLESNHLKAALPTDTNRPNEIMKFGFPSNSNISVRRNFVMGYDNRLRNAAWVFEHLNKELLSQKESNRAESVFVEDPSIHRFFRGTNRDFYNSGYDRGHLAAASNHRASQEWMNETFYLSNIIPQNPFMNRQAWNKLEKHVRRLAYSYDNLYICTGPLFLPRTDHSGKMHVKYEVIGKNHVAVPTHLFKIVVCERNSRFELMSFLMPNEWVDPDLPVETFLYPIEAIERAAGLMFFDRIPRSAFLSINKGKETTL